MATSHDSPLNPSNPPAPKDDSTEAAARPSIAQSHSSLEQSGSRRTSFNFLRRTSGKSSSETRGTSASRSASGSKMSKKQKALAHEEALRRQREANMLPNQPPRLPSHSALPQIATFGGEDARPDSIAIVSNKVGTYNPNALNFSRPSMDTSRLARQPSQPSPGVMSPAVGMTPGSFVDQDPYPRIESMTNRGRYSYDVLGNALPAVGQQPRQHRQQPSPCAQEEGPHALQVRCPISRCPQCPPQANKAFQYPRRWLQGLGQVCLYRVPAHCTRAARS